jgi:hypothetical protein
MFVKRCLLAVILCGALAGCGGGPSGPAPVGKQDPLPDPQQPHADSQNPSPDPQAPRIGVEEPPPVANDPALPGGEAGASATDD